MALEDEIRRFISDTFILEADVADLPGDASLTGSGVIDSVGVLELIGFLESQYGIDIAESEALPENLDSISSIVGFLEAKLSRAT